MPLKYNQINRAHNFFLSKFSFLGSEDVQDNDLDQSIIHYVIVDIWDKDKINDDFMGRVMVPVSLLSHESLCGWFPLGRTSSRDAQFTGEIYLELRIKSQLVRYLVHLVYQIKVRDWFIAVLSQYS